MSIQTDASHYEKAMILAENGHFQEALDLVENHLQESPDDAEALNDAAVLLHCMERSDEAIEKLNHARELVGDKPEIIWNLVEAHLALAQAEQARPLLTLMERQETINVDVLNRAANTLLNQEKFDDALDMLNWSLRLCPDQEILKPMIEVIHHKKGNHGNDQ